MKHWNKHRETKPDLEQTNEEHEQKFDFDYSGSDDDIAASFEYLSGVDKSDSDIDYLRNEYGVEYNYEDADDVELLWEMWRPVLIRALKVIIILGLLFVTFIMFFLTDDWFVTGDPRIDSIIYFLITFVVQLILCCFVKDKYLRHISLAVPMLVLLYTVRIYLSDFGLPGINFIVGIVYAGVALSGLLGYGIAWFIWLVCKQVAKKRLTSVRKN